MKGQKTEMSTRVRRLKIAVTLTVVISLAIVILVPSSSVVGIALKLGPEGLPLPDSDFSAVPQSVVEDATRLATEVHGDYQENHDDFIDQLLATYLEARDKDFVIFFNSGGWGWNILEASPQWTSIFTGIQSELADLGYTLLLLNYQRTINTVQGYFSEAMSMINLYPSQAKDLAGRVNFLTKHIPDLKVVITGESNGTVIADSAMSILSDNPQVYSIQTGPPFWHKNVTLERTLVLQGNGIMPDYFSQGDLLTLICANLEALFGFSQAEDGKILLYLSSPGHEYGWHYPEVCSQITSFLQENFGLK